MTMKCATFFRGEKDVVGIVTFDLIGLLPTNHTLFSLYYNGIQAPVVQTSDSAIHRINLYLLDTVAQLVSLILIHWIVIYPVDSAIQRLNNRRQKFVRKR